MMNFGPMSCWNLCRGQVSGIHLLVILLKDDGFVAAVENHHSNSGGLALCPAHATTTT